ncbi:AbfB domain-containing protein [Nonomuraea sp. SBT364]|uniref:AbfB domain-containing protein n=1 Tax=Nonomuraea sp. SBT364 TaxID=1580530 RepID=UPI003FA52BE6
MTDSPAVRRRGLAYSSCYSFESVNFPGSYLRHHDAGVWSANGTGGTWNRPQTLTADSTWNLATPWTPWPASDDSHVVVTAGPSPRSSSAAPC